MRNHGGSSGVLECGGCNTVDKLIQSEQSSSLRERRECAAQSPTVFDFCGKKPISGSGETVH
jgi:hypothetical protein